MKKRGRVLLLIAAILTLTLTTQTAKAGGGIKLVQMGIRGGLQTQSIHMNKNDLISGFTTDKDFGYQLGFMARVNLMGLFIQPELMYSSHKFSFDMGEYGSTKIKVKNVEVPVLLGFKLLFLNLYAGPVFNLLTETANKGGKATVAINSDFYKSAMSYQLGAGVELGNVTLDVRYGGQFKKAIQTISIGTNTPVDIKTRMNQWMFNVGYFF